MPRQPQKAIKIFIKPKIYREHELDDLTNSIDFPPTYHVFKPVVSLVSQYSLSFLLVCNSFSTIHALGSANDTLTMNPQPSALSVRTIFICSGPHE